MDLATQYMGLALRNPIVASPTLEPTALRKRSHTSRLVPRMNRAPPTRGAT